MARSGQVYTVSYHIGNSHNREGINCSYCHSVETVRMMNDTDGDLGQYTLAKPMKMGPIGPVVRNAGDTLHYSPDASTLDMNAFFALIGPEKYVDTGATPKDAAGVLGITERQLKEEIERFQINPKECNYELLEDTN